MNTAKRRRRVDCEISLHKSLPIHPSIVKFGHSFEDGENIYILTEYCPGSTLFSYLQDNYPTGLSEVQARSIFLSLLQAVSFLHLNGILHRDLKLTNVLLTSTLQIRIADFGLATKLEDATSDQEMTMCGTPNYIAPEVVKRDPYGISSDVWSLGCMLVALLTGRPPFQGAQISETLHLVARGSYRPLPRGASRGVKNLVHSILQVDPRKRLTTSEILTHPWLASAASKHNPEVSPLADSFAGLRTSSGTNQSRALVQPSPTVNVVPRSMPGGRRIPMLNTDLMKKITPCIRSNNVQSNPSEQPFRFGESVENGENDPWRKKPSTGYQSLVSNLRSHGPVRGDTRDFQHEHRDSRAFDTGEVHDQPNVQEYHPHYDPISSISTDASENWHKHQQMVPPVEKNHETYSDRPPKSVPNRWSVWTTEEENLAQFHDNQKLGERGAPGYRPLSGHTRQWSHPMPSRPTPPSELLRKYSTSDALSQDQNAMIRTVKEQRQGYNEQRGLDTYYDHAQEVRYSYASERSSQIQDKPSRQHMGISHDQRNTYLHQPSVMTAHGEAHHDPPAERIRSPPLRSTRFSTSPVATRESSRQQPEDIVSLVHDIVRRDDLVETKAEGEQKALSSHNSMEDGSLDIVEKYKFTTTDLRPTSQKTKHGEVSILKSGMVSVSLTKDKRQHLISGDGEEITVINKDGQEKSYPLAELPARSFLAYRFASKFVNMVRSKSVKIALDSSTAKCRLYNNDQFEVILLNHERKVTLAPESRAVKIASHDSVLWKGQLDEVDPTMREWVRQALIWWTRCKDAMNEPVVHPIATPRPHQVVDSDAQKVTARFIDGHGWCEKRDAENLWVVFFLDGVSMELYTESRTLKLTNPDHVVEEYTLAAGLPEPIRKRLKITARAMSLFTS